MNSSAICSRFVLEIYPKHSDSPVYLESDNKIVNGVATCIFHPTITAPQGYSEPKNQEYEIYCESILKGDTTKEEWESSEAICEKVSAILELGDCNILSRCQLSHLVNAIQLLFTKIFPQANPNQSSIQVKLTETYPLVTSLSTWIYRDDSGQDGNISLSP